MAAAALQTSFPALVRRRFVASWSPLSADDLQFIHDGGIILDKDHFAAWGVWLGQDPLHVYFRLIESLDWQSWDAAYAVRCLRKLLQSWTSVDDAEFKADLQEDIQDRTYGIVLFTIIVLFFCNKHDWLPIENSLRNQVSFKSSSFCLAHSSEICHSFAHHFFLTRCPNYMSHLQWVLRASGHKCSSLRHLFP